MQITCSNSFSSAPWIARAAWRQVLAAPVSGQRPVLALDLTGWRFGIGTTRLPFERVVSCTRAGTKSVVTATGAITSVAANTIAQHFVSTARTTSLEPPATNLVLQSHAMSTSPWGLNGSVVTADNGSAPDGGDMVKVAPPFAKTGDVSVYQTGAVIVGQTYTVSVVVRRDQHRYAQLFGFGNGGAGVGFDLVAGTAQVNNAWLSAGVQILSATHARIWGVLVPAVNATANFGLASDIAGNKVFTGSEELSFWGAQIEPGRVPTSLISSTTAYATRAGDHLAAGLGERWSTGPTSLFLDVDLLGSPQSQTLARVRSQDGADVLTLTADANGHAVARFVRSATPVAAVTGALLVSGRNRLVVRAGSGGLALAQSGAEVSVPGFCEVGAGALFEYDGLLAEPFAPLFLRRALVFAGNLSESDAAALSSGA